MVHLGTRAVGGAGLVMAEATAVLPEGRISQWDQGIWSDAHIDVLRPITKFIDSAGSIPAVQLAHAGRKASHAAPWIGSGLLSEDGEGWKPVAPSALPFDEDYAIPAELSEQEMRLGGLRINPKTNIGSAAFFAPLIFIDPLSFFPPWTNI